MKAKITKCDHSGDSVIAEFDTDVDESVDIAQEALTEFLDDCVKKYGEAPPVWGRRINEDKFGEFDADNLNAFAEVLIHPPIVGG